MQDHSEVSSVPSGVLFLLGLGAGVAVALLLAPKSGAESRRAIAETAEKGVEKVAGNPRQLAADLMPRLRDFWSRHRQDVQTAVSVAGRFYKDVVVPLRDARAKA